MILGRPWLTTIDALIGCRGGEWTISNRHSTKKITLYPPSQPIIENILWLENPYMSDGVEIIQPVLTIEQSMNLKDNTRDGQHYLNYLLGPSF
jgi:hypothetical protein